MITVKRARVSALRNSLLCGIALPLVATQALAQSQPERAPTSDAASPQQPGVATVEEVVVTGIRRSLQSALIEKRDADNLVEVIKAEDIGKLPDQNLAEVLENVTGIQISREAGVGNMVQIRGTDANRVEINGVSTVGSGSGRSGISFDDLPASLISSVEVTKVSEAKTVEGSVGGTINLRTIRPLSLRKPLVSARVQGERSDLAKSNLPRVSGTLGDRWDTGVGEIGLVVSGSYARQDVTAFNPRVDRDALVMPGTSPSAKSFPFLRLQFLQQGQENYEYETYNGTTALEWKPADNLRLYFDGTFNRQERAQQSYRVQLSGVSAAGVVDTTNNTSFETVNLGKLDGPDGPIDLGTVQAVLTGTMGVTGTTGQVVDPNLRTSSDTGSRITKSRVLDFGADWQATDRLSVRVEGAISTSKSDFPNFSTTLDFINPLGPQPAYGKSLDNGVPLAFDLRNGTLQFGFDKASPFAPTAAQMLNPANYKLQQVSQNADRADNEEKAARIDVEYDASHILPFGTTIDAGYRWNKTSAIKDVVTNNVSYTNTTTAWNRPSGNLFAEMLSPGPSNFDAADGRTLFFPNFLLINPDTSFKDPAKVLVALNSAIAASNAAKTVGPDLPSLASPTESAAGYFKINETTSALYVQANFKSEVAGTPIRGNAGLRWVSTKIESTGNNVSSSTSATQTTAKSSYDVYLPRFSLVVEPSDKFLVRLGAARDIRRPDFDKLSTSATFSTGANTPVSVGNPDLVPETVWSLDLSGEYYFAPSSLISVGVFHKIRGNLFAARQEDPAPNLINGQLNIDITPPCESGGIYNPIANRNINNPIAGVGICVPVSSTFNVQGQTTQSGVEFAFQHDLSAWEDRIGWASGFGFIGNVTLQKSGGNAKEYRAADGPRTIFTLLGKPKSKDLITLTNFSKTSYNTTLFYDKYGLNARVRYTWRSSYVSDDPFYFGLPLINGARGQLNASLNYAISDRFTVGLEGVNLLRGDQVQYCVNNKALLCFQGLTDRRLSAGLSMRF